MNIAAEKAEIIRMFNDVHDARLIKAIKSLLDFGLEKQEEDAVYDDHNDPELKASIQEAIEDGKNGFVRPYEEFMAEVRKKYRA